MSTLRILLAALCLTLMACGAKKPPPSKSYTLGGTKIEYRDYGLVRGSICGVDPRRLSDELTKINTLLEEFVSGTEAATQPEATAEQVELLREGSQSLGPVVDAHRKNIAGLRACDFQRKPPFPDLTKKGEEVLTSAKARLDAAPEVLAAADARIAEQKWKEDSAKREATAKQDFCKAGTAVGSGDLYFARQESDGKKRWLFCDGLTVEAPSGADPTLVIPESISKKDRRRIQASRYLEAAKSYPAEEIDRLGAEKKEEAE
ncbi:hypothetical protein [Hyalangium rubrum]|uniref:Lipoprotein n=1 Tax=Hyalangium rubrum TaxID=3103134 RepID=A0ABU5H4I2_9BACT|nr:hypothetical protein [Hyalangium sp. s54d21]MDY7228379.1 hypothetical protein [Hyalangium sp. s54d21]